MEICELIIISIILLFGYSFFKFILQDNEFFSNIIKPNEILEITFFIVFASPLYNSLIYYFLDKNRCIVKKLNYKKGCICCICRIFEESIKKIFDCFIKYFNFFIYCIFYCFCCCCSYCNSGF